MAEKEGTDERYSRTTLESIANGEVAEKFASELLRVMANVDDLNTEAKDTRSISIEFKFTPDGSRQAIETVVKIKTKLCGPRATESVVFVVRDHTGEVFAVNDNIHQPALFKS